MAMNSEDWSHPYDRFDAGDNPTEFISETALKAITYLEALNGSDLPLSKVNDHKGLVVEMWQAIADRRASRDDVLVWAESVAKAVCKNILIREDIKTTSKKAREGAMKALGLSGRSDENFAARETLQRFLDYRAFIRQASPHPERISTEPSRQECLQFLRSQGFYGSLSDKAAGLRIDRLLNAIC